MSGFRRIVLVGAVLARRDRRARSCRRRRSWPIRGTRPGSSPRTCSACHKSPQGLGQERPGRGLPAPALHHRSGNERRDGGLSGRGRECARPAKKGARRGTGREKQQGQEAGAGRRRPSRGAEPRPMPRISARCAASSGREASDEPQPSRRQPAARSADAGRAGARSRGRTGRRCVAQPPRPRRRRSPRRTRGPPPVVFDMPLPEMPTAPPADLTQSVFSSSPLP